MNPRRQQLERTSANGATNAALWLDRYLDQEADNQTVATFVRSALALLKVPDGYERAAKARQDTLRGLRGESEAAEARVYSIKIRGRVVCGIGIASILQNGLALQRTWGMPIIPGSSLKGIAAARANSRADAGWHGPAAPGQPASEYHRALFGDVAGAGVVTFHDAWWQPTDERPQPFALDVITPHHVDYYTKTGDAAPADWDSPSPNPLLTVCGTFFTALVGPSEWLDLAEDLLRSALDQDGVGAKTAAGYGRADLGREHSQVEKAAALQREEATKALEQAKRAVADRVSQVRGPQHFADLAKAVDKALRAGAGEDVARGALAKLSPDLVKKLRKWAAEGDQPVRRQLQPLLGPAK